jgi:DNA-binding LacI/PurR family transcriptional regulator
MKKSVTLKDVAIQAGVSYQTVSKVLNQKMRVSKETDARIRAAIDALGYRPNLIARSLQSQRSRLIGFSWNSPPTGLVSSVTDQFLQSMMNAAAAQSYHLLLFPSHSGSNWISAYRELIDTHRVDGFVISDVEYDDPRIICLQKSEVPFVAFGRSNPGWDFPYVDVDGEAGMRGLVNHLVELGHRQIMGLSLPENSRVGQNRMDGFMDAIRESEILFSPNWIARGEGSALFGEKASNYWLGLPQGKRPTAIIAFNDALAAGAMRAARTKGLEIGVDVSIAGYEDTPIASLLYPPLTSVRQPIWKIGQHVISMLLAILNEKDPDRIQILIPPELVIRESTGPCPAIT